ncbi:hypothetical protein BYT27DRAFT_7279327 [Phlegmacium glaucopus]|nr:hypothetical protein BYT27DRAFT_7279327 [Phlegmacium glaucopus]
MHNPIAGPEAMQYESFNCRSLSKQCRYLGHAEKGWHKDGTNRDGSGKIGQYKGAPGIKPGTGGGGWAAGGLEKKYFWGSNFENLHIIIQSVAAWAAQVLGQKGAEPENVGKTYHIWMKTYLIWVGEGGGGVGEALEKKIYPV